MLSKIHNDAGVAEWQTRMVQVHMKATSWGFKSLRPHHKKVRLIIDGLFCVIAAFGNYNVCSSGKYRKSNMIIALLFYIFPPLIHVRLGDPSPSHVARVWFSLRPHHKKASVISYPGISL